MKRTTSIIVSIIVVLLVALCIFFISSKEEAKEPYNKETISMGTVVFMSIYGEKESAENTSVEITKIINRLDTKNLSWRIEKSDIFYLNQNFAYEVSEITSNCIKTCLEISGKSDGLFDITVGDLTTLWGIGTETAKVPTEDEIKEAIKLVDYKKVSVSGNTVKIGEGQKIDLGAVGKGLACDEVYKYIKTTDTEGAVISVGGSLLVYGKNPENSTGTWRIGIRNPFGSSNESAGIISLNNSEKNGAYYVSTSGDYEKTLTENGKTYHHILNPKTGYPAESNVTGVTVIAPSGTLSDALSTVCFSLGYSDESLELLKAYNAEAVFILKDKTVYATDGISKDLVLTSDSFTLK
ncbi:MAG: FAD:protein FMN transferase [Oscillospiraceae bacterium]|nr:FAD:protein FMN transferase [Oscillospiraceae bacterium]